MDIHVDMNERYLGIHPEAKPYMDAGRYPPLMYAAEREALRKAVVDDKLEVRFYMTASYGGSSVDRVTHVVLDSDHPEKSYAYLNGSERRPPNQARTINLWNVFPNKFQVVERRPLFPDLD